MKKTRATEPTVSPVLERLEPFLPKKGESAAFVGVSQNGKTTEAWRWASALNSAVGCVAWDPAGQWGVDSFRKDHGDTVGPLKRTMTVSTFEQHPEALLEPQVSLAVMPDDIWADRLVIAADFVRFAMLLVRQSPPGRRLAVFIDECNQLTDLPSATRLLTDMAERWGKEGIVPFFITQRWTHLSTDVRAEVAWLLSFHQNKRSDLKQLRYDAGSDFAAAVEQLEPYQYRARFLRKALPEHLTAGE